MLLLRKLELFLCVVCFASFVWAVFFFFQTKGSSGRLGKKIISFCGSIAIVASIYTAIIFPTPNFNWLTASITLFIVAILLFWWSAWTVRNRKLDFAFSSSHPTFVIRSGPFRIVRHPFYLSYVCAWIGACCATELQSLTVVPILMSILYFLAARSEEQAFHFGEKSTEYQEYRKKTPMFIPFTKFFG